jgi:LytS/YehU family sensor histidine kinase
VQDGHLIIEVANTGHLRTDDPAPGGTGTGLANVRARLAAQYPDAHAFALAEDDGWVRARLDIETPAIDSSPSHA